MLSTNTMHMVDYVALKARFQGSISHINSSGIAGFYASEYITTGGIAQQVTTLNMDKYIPSKTVTLPVIQPASMDVNPFQQAGVLLV